MPYRDCDACGDRYEYQRKSSRFCSPTCRYRWFAAGSRRTRIPDNLRFDILRRDSFRCRTCGFGPEDWRELRVDHLIPVEKGGALTDASNLVTLCHECNSGKGTRMLDPDELPAAATP